MAVPPGQGPWQDPDAWAKYPPPVIQQPAYGTDPRALNVRRPVQPDSVALAVKLMYVGAALALLSVLVFFVTLNGLKTLILENDPWMTESRLDAEIARATLQNLFRSLVGFALWVWMAVKNGDGRLWARVVSTVLGGIWLLGAVLVLTTYGISDLFNLLPLLGFLILVQTALAITILVLLYRPASSAYYRDMNRWQAAVTLRGY